MKKIYYIAAFILSTMIGSGAFAQTYTMTNGQVSACSGTFYDPGGTGTYGNSQNFTYTICPSTPGAKVVINFTAFATEANFDFLTIYNGPNTASPTLGTYTGIAGPGIVSATPTNASGCLTFVFTSDGSVVGTGWTGTISCSTPCPTITSGIASTTPAAVGGIIRRCPNQSTTFTATAGSGGTGPYTYTWTMGNGTTLTGQTINYAYPTSGSYQVSLVVRDVNNCPTTLSYTVIVQVATTPTITTSATPNPICLGQSSNLAATVAMTPFVPNCTPPVAGTTFLPDGSGVSYTTAITVNCFAPGQTVTAASNFSNICLSLEHSYLGDLNIVLICPNGQSMILKSYGQGGNGTYLGNALDDGTTNPGTGFTYCFTPTATTFLVNGPTVLAGNPLGNSIAAGNYMPLNPFSNLIGCPLNGAWTIQVTDNLAIDNGYIFNWDVNFTVPAATGAFTPTIASQGWSAATGLTSTGTTTATVTPTAVGSPCYTYSVTDNFGCTFTQNQCITVTANTPVNAGPDVTICNAGSTALTATGATTYSWSPAIGLSATTGASVTANPTVTTTYTVTGTTGTCISTDQVVVNVALSPAVNAGPDKTFCIGGSTTLTATGATTYSWSPATGLSATTGASVTANPTVNTTYTVTGTTAGCTATDQVLVTVNPLPTINGGVDQTVCAGQTVTLTATGGATYTWSPVVTNGTAFTPVATGTYTVTGTSAAGCINTDQVLVTVNPLPTIVVADVTICATATATLTATGATTYAWSPSTNLSAATGATVTFTPGTTTTYTITGTTAGCTSTDLATVTVLPNAAINAGADAAICTGASTTLTATGGVTYTWSPATGLSATTGASVTANPTATTTYTVTGTDANGCVGTDQVIVTVNPLPTINGGADQTVCAGQTVTLTATGGATYTWAPVVTNGTAFTPAATGTYTVTGTDANGCINTDQVLVTVNPLPVFVVADATICATATATLTATGATTYSWSPTTNLSAATGATVTFTPGTTTTYTITGTTAGCTSTDLATVTVLPNAAINAGADAAICTGASTTLTATGGVTYTWSPATGLSATTGASVTANPTATTTYTVTGTDANGCVGTDQVIVTVNPLPTINGGVDQTVCAGQTVTLTATGGTTYTWAPVVTNGTAFTPAATGTYTVTGTDANGCINTDQVLVTVNPLPVVVVADVTICATATATLTATGATTYSWSPATNLSAATGATVTFTPGTTTTYTITGTSLGCTSTDQATVTVLPNAPINAGADVAICTGASTPLTATGGVTYTWSPATGLSATTGASVTANPTTTTTYSVTGTDANGCIGTDQVIVTVNPLPIINGGVDQTVCAGQTVTLTAAGGATYTWVPVATNGTAFTPAATGTYTVTGTSAAGCINTDQVLVTVNPLPVVVVADVTICATATATLTATGATTYSWSPATNLSAATGATVTFTPGTTTTYTITGTSLGCTSTDQATVTVLPNAPINAGADVAICTGASTTLTATGGVTYTWSPATGLSATTGASVTANPTTTTTYSVTGTDANGCIGTDQVIVTVNPLPIINGGVDQTVCAGQTVILTATGGATYTWAPVVTNGTAFTPAATGTYTVTGTDANGCINTDQVLVTVNPLPVVVVADVTICATATATLTATGATTYSWAPATNLSAATGATVTFTPGTTTTYTITGTTLGCTSTDQATVTVLPNAPINAGTDAVICAGASTTLTATGGVTYSWSPATGLSATTGASVIANPTTTTTYSVTGTDASGCIGTDQVLVTVNPLPTINGGVDQTVCAGQTVTLTATGGATYTWAPVVTNGTTFTPAATGTYTVTGTDANGCVSTDAVLITVNPLPTIVVADVTICATATATLTATGGVTYAWSPATNLDVVVGPSVVFTPGTTTTYTITGTDANGCVSTDQAIVSVLANAPINAGVDVAICTGASTTLTATGGVTYTWSPATGLSATTGASVTANPTATTTYTATGTDANGCVGTDQVIVTVNPLPIINGGVDQTACAGQSVTLTASGGTAYTWAPVVTNGTAFTPAATGTYTVTGTSAAGCINTDQVLVTVNPLPVVVVADVTICATATATLTATGATTYSWAPATNLSAATGATVTFTPGTTTTYTITGTTAGCTSTDLATVTVLPNAPINAGADAAICTGASTTLTATGGVTYTWSPATGLSATTGASATANPTTTTTYTVTGTDANGCVGTDQVIVTVNPLPIINGGVDQTVCVGQTVTLTATGGATYTWAPVVTNGTTFTPAATGTYTVTGTDANGCVNTDQVLVTVNPLPVVVVADVTICATATATLTATGATTYSWAPATNLSAATGATVTFTPGTTTTYTITGTDANGCVSTDQAIVSVLANAPINAGADVAICAGASTTLTATGGVTYTWSPATGLSATTGASVTANPTTTTTYTVTGTDANGCVGTDQVIVTVNPLPIINGGVDQTVCVGQTVTLTATGGATYTWAPVVTNGTTFTPAATGTYTVTGTDANGCINTDQVLVTVNPLPTIAVADVTICATATATLTATGATTYSWSPATNLSAATGATVTFTPGTTTTYTITGTDSNGCVSTDQAIVSVLANAPINAGADAAICTGASTTLTATGGVTFTWSPATGLSATTGASVTANPTTTTTYSVTGTDASGCVGTDQVIVTANPLPTINGGVDQSVCIGQTVTLTATGAATYTWAPVVTNGTAFTPAATGTYTVTGTDANGCINTDQVLVTVNPLPVVVVADVTICATATATLTATGGVTYAWSPATNLDVVAGPSAVFTPGTTTTYTITGTDANGCVSTDQAIVSVLANAPINAGTDAAICTGASTTLTATGGVTYTWSPATGLSATTGASVTANPTATTTYTVTGTDANGCVGTDQVIVTVNPLPTINGGADQTVCIGQTVTLTATGAATYTWAPVVTNGTAFTPAATGTYTVTGTDANGCINTDQVLVTVNPLPVVVVADVTICATATATLTATGGVTYAWSPATNLDVVVGPSVVFTPGTTTTYTITGTDANGCVSTDQAIVSVLANAPINAGADAAICTGASTTLTATGGVTYTWSPATGLSATTGASVTANPTNPTTYTVSGTDASGCVGTDQVIVTVNPLPSINGGVDQTVCIGQTVTLTATGATTYSWAPVVTNGIVFTPAIGSTTYTVTGTSAGCTSTDQVVVNVNPLPTIGAGVDVAICINGSTTLTATGGSTYTWSPATGLSATTGVIVTANPTATSTYTVTGTDANGCISADQVIVSVNPLPTVNAGLDVAVCAGQTVTLNGTGAITYSWTAPVVNGLAFAPAATTTYTLTGTSAVGCVNTDQVLVTVNPLPTVIGGPDQTVCIGAQVTLIGQGAATYSWSPLVTNGIAFTPVLGATTYTVTGTTAAGCTSTDQLVVTATALPTINAGTDVSVCDGSQVTLTATGGITYTWAPSITNVTPFVPTIGSTTYSVTGTDANGCIASDQVIVLVNQLPTVNAGNDVVICAGVPITLTGSGAANYTWSPVIANNVPFIPGPGISIYTVTGTTAAGCTGTDQLTVTVNPNLLADFTPVSTVGCTPLTVTFTNNTLNSVNCVWSMGDGTTLTGCSTVTNTYEQPGCYDVTLTVTAQNGCVSNLTVLDAVCVEGFPNAEFAPSTNTINEYDMEVSFNNNSTGASNYVWDFGDGSPNSTDIDPIHDYTNSPYGNYEVMLVAISPAGCSDTAYSVIQIIEELIYYVPNTFTPDGDTYNQTFKPVFTSGFDIYDYALYIYDRWGEVIFESHDANYGWDGAYGTDKKRDVQDGTYTWVIEFKVSMNDERKRVNGHVNVIR